MNPGIVDQDFMEHALSLAAATAGRASPNPQVGCVLVRHEKIIAEGAHIYEQRDHAEIAALKQASAQGESTFGATAYVTLEPCSHHGRTGPCADALIQAGIARCVIATEDPNPQVSGQGIARLRAAGVEVEVGVCQAQARSMNDAFAWSIQHGSPMVTLKSALSVDGRLAPPPSSRSGVAQPFWLTGPAAREEVQRMRHASDAILTGIGTVLADDPHLTDRTGLPRRRPLLRVVLDSQLRMPVESTLVHSSADDLWICCTDRAEHMQKQKADELRRRGTRLISLAGEGRLLVPEVLSLLFKAEIRSVLLEAGPGLNGAFLQAGLVQKAVLFFSEIELGPGSLPFAEGTETAFQLTQRLLQMNRTMFGPDVCLSGLLAPIWPA